MVAERPMSVTGESAVSVTSADDEVIRRIGMPGVPTYYQITQNGGNRRWWIENRDYEWLRTMEWLLLRGVPLKSREWPSPAPIYTYTKCRRIEDMPMTSASIDIVSDRLREIWEREAPGAVQFWPVRVEPVGCEPVTGQYWAVNWLAVVDCLAPESFDEDERGRFVQFCIVDRKRIPSDVKIGVVRGYEVQRFIRSDLKRKMIAEGIIGPQYLSLGQV